VFGCEAFETNPYVVNFDRNEMDLTQKQLDKLAKVLSQNPNKSKINIAFISDSQLALDELEDGIDHINKNPNVDMVFHGGDITHYASNIEYKKMGEVLRKLKAPFFTAFGNHDALSTGEESYRAMFGVLDYSFKAWGHKFVFFNANHYEFIFRGEEVPDIGFLRNQLAEPSDGFENIFMISHMGPFHQEFGDENSQVYHQLMLSDDRIKLSLHGHGHTHNFGELYSSGFDYLQVDNTADSNYILLTIQTNGDYEFERVFY
jgi:predicted MPP superfamily phosphohydrolase